MIKLVNGDSLNILKGEQSESIDCCVTSPPYFGLRDYKVDGQIGLELSPKEYVSKLVEVFSEVKRVLKKDGTLWLNIGDSYSASVAGSITSKKQMTNRGTNDLLNDNIPKRDFGIPYKNLIGIPWMLAFAMRDTGWILRQDIIWHKPNCFPESVKDRCTRSHEYVFLFSKSKRYYYDYKAIMEKAVCGEQHANKTTSFGSKNPSKTNAENYAFKGDNHTCYKSDDGKYMKNKRDVWSINTKPYKGAHMATFPEALIEPCILAGCPENGIVLDPFSGSGTTGVVSRSLNRSYFGIELNAEYHEMAKQRIGIN